MGFVGAGEVHGFDAAGLGGGTAADFHGEAFDFVEAGVFADGFGFESADFEAVVIGGVVGGGDLDAAAAAEMVDGEVDFGGVDHADIDDVGAGGEDAFDKGLGHGRGAEAHVASDDDHVHAGVGFGEAAEVHRPEELELRRGRFSRRFPHRGGRGRCHGCHRLCRLFRSLIPR